LKKYCPRCDAFTMEEITNFKFLCTKCGIWYIESVDKTMRIWNKPLSATEIKRLDRGARLEWGA